LLWIQTFLSSNLLPRLSFEGGKENNSSESEVEEVTSNKRTKIFVKRRIQPLKKYQDFLTGKTSGFI
jgi:hypothetical protein